VVVAGMFDRAVSEPRRIIHAMSDDEPEEPPDDPRAETEDHGEQVPKAARAPKKGVDKGVTSALGADFANGIGSGLAGVMGAAPLDGGITEAIGNSNRITEALRKLVGATPIMPMVNVPGPIDDVRSRAESLAKYVPLIDPTPRRTADAVEQTAEYTRDLLNAMRESLQLNESVRQENTEAANFTRLVSILTIVVAFASLGLGVASLVVAIVAINRP